jgi:hypothetical protein
MEFLNITPAQLFGEQLPISTASGSERGADQNLRSLPPAALI